MNAHPGDLDDGGRWVETFATDCQAGDTVRLTDDRPRHLIVERDYPPSWARNLRLSILDGDKVVDRAIGKTAKIEIWDTDGSVTQRVQDLSAQAIR